MKGAVQQSFRGLAISALAAVCLSACGSGAESEASGDTDKAATKTVAAKPERAPSPPASAPPALATAERFEGELILLAAPPPGNTYEAAERQTIIEFQIGFAKSVTAPDRVIILTGPDSHDIYAEALGDGALISYLQADIWLRDSAPVNLDPPVLFRAAATRQGGGGAGHSRADAVQYDMRSFLKAANLRIRRSDLISDGGNIISDGDGRLIVSRRFLRDNSLSEAQGRTALARVTGAKAIAFIKVDPQDRLGHIESYAIFSGPNTVLLNDADMSEDEAKRMVFNLREDLSGVTLHRLTAQRMRRGALDAPTQPTCGLYSNMVVTPRRLYVPVFGRETDKDALTQLHSQSDKDIVPVDASQICELGGGVRNMSWQLRGQAASKVLAFQAQLERDMGEE